MGAEGIKYSVIESTVRSGTPPETGVWLGVTMGVGVSDGIGVVGCNVK